MLEYVSGDLTSLKDKHDFIIVQQVNCQGAMGAGLARAIMNTWSDVKPNYLKWCSMHPDKAKRLGRVQTTKLGKNGFICNIFGQMYYGKSGHYTNEAKLLEGIAFVVSRASWVGLPVYIPENIGSGLAGGNKSLILQGIKYAADKVKTPVYLVHYSKAQLQFSVGYLTRHALTGALQRIVT